MLNDINPHAINFYSQLRKGLRIKLEMSNDSDFYYECREEFNALITSGKGYTRRAAELFYFLNRTGYNGLCRFNKQGLFNVPFGSYKKINYISDFSAYQKIFENWTFTIGDFQSVAIEKAAFIYADPPYDVYFTQYAKEGFGWEDQVRLAEWLAKHKGPVVLSNQATDRIVSLYRALGFRLSFLDAPRMISCTGNRAKVAEVVATRGI